MAKGKLSFLDSFKMCNPKSPSSMVIQSRSASIKVDDMLLHTPLNSKSFDVLFSYNPTPPPSSPASSEHVRSRSKARSKSRFGNKSNGEALDGAADNGCKRFGSKEREHHCDRRRKQQKPPSVELEVKKSSDPLKDFKRSMLEMILDRRIFEARELDELLMSFLSLNSRVYHSIIIQAFVEIVREVFVDDDTHTLMWWK